METIQTCNGVINYFNASKTHTPIHPHIYNNRQLLYRMERFWICMSKAANVICDYHNGDDGVWWRSSSSSSLPYTPENECYVPPIGKWSFGQTIYTKK